MFVGGDGRPGQLCTGAQALDDADHYQQNRCPDTDRGVAGDQTDQRGAHTHHAERDNQYMLAAEAVAQVAKQNPAEWARDKTDGKRGERQQ
ncbi:hypothetical protein D3C73_1351910 [compost metagenome]